MSHLTHLLDLRKRHYLWSGCWGRLRQRKACPCCGSPHSGTVDRKLTYTLERCGRCFVKYRFPSETAADMRRYYQADYDAGDITTDLPDAGQLAELLRRNFAGSDKDFSRVVGILRGLGLADGARVLDYGASWGYCAYQLRRAGFRAEAYEVSRPRAEFGKRIGVDIADDLRALGGGFDAVYSSHVLEHAADPLAALREQLGLTRPGGFVVAHTPNGSAAFMRAEPRKFHRSWGQPHPVLLDDEFVFANLGGRPCFVSAGGDAVLADQVARWDRAENFAGDLAAGHELLIIVCNRPKQ